VEAELTPALGWLTAAVSIAVATSAQGQTVKFLLSWSGQSQIVAPEPRVSRFSTDLEVTLHSGNRVSERFVRRNPRGEVSLTTEGEARLSEGMDSGPVKWTVRDSRTLVRIFEPQTHVFTITLTTDGATRCAARPEFRLKPGSTTYLIPDRRGPQFASRVEIAKMTCRVIGN
jgi:hypothetical protein